MAKNVISDGQAKKIANDYKYGKEGECLRIFRDSGAIKEEMQREIGRMLGRIPPGRDRRELLALAKYCRNRGMRGFQIGWHDLSLEYTEVTVDQV